MSHSDSVDRARARQAAQWYVEVDEAGGIGGLHEQADAFAAWVAVPENARALDKYAGLSAIVARQPHPGLPNAREVAADRLSEQTTESWPLPAAPNASAGEQPARLPWAWPLSIAAALLLAVAGFSYLNARLNTDGVESWHPYVTGIAETREVRLPDGTLVTLGARTSLTVHYTPARRNIILREGEALFRVRHDATRPFTVWAGNGSITAVGTVFDVARLAQRVSVTVTEGAVDVAPRTPGSDEVEPEESAVPLENPRWAPARVSKDQQMVYQQNGDASAVERTDSSLVTAWSEGRLQYRRRSLLDVVADLNRYSRHTISVDPQAGELQFTGTISTRDVDDWVSGLKEVFPVEAVRTDDDHILIRFRGNAQDQ